MTEAAWWQASGPQPGVVARQMSVTELRALYRRAPALFVGMLRELIRFDSACGCRGRRLYLFDRACAQILTYPSTAQAHAAMKGLAAAQDTLPHWRERAASVPLVVDLWARVAQLADPELGRDPGASTVGGPLRAVGTPPGTPPPSVCLVNPSAA
jgi:hypothetical protein